MASNVESIKAYHATSDFGNREGLDKAKQHVAACYRSLNANETRSLIQFALQHVDSDEDTAEVYLEHLACFQSGCLAELHLQLLDHKFLKPSVAFAEANEEVSKRLVRRIEDFAIDDALRALGWIGDAAAQQAFATWRENPPHWASQIEWDWHDYCELGGWQLTQDGANRVLTLHQCYPLVRDLPNEFAADFMQTNIDHADQCQWCRRTLTTLFTLNTFDQRLRSIPFKGRVLNITTCDVCTCYGQVFTSVGTDGTSRWFGENKVPEFLPDNGDTWQRLQPNILKPSQELRDPMESASWFMPINFSQVGGQPTWVQYPEYPTCPKCESKMMFIAQLDRGDCEESGEGIYYSFLCTGCQITATTFQQS